MPDSPSRPTRRSSRSGAQRLQAYRQRLAEGDLVRTEILLPRPVRDAIQDVARAEGARYLETVSALAQFGLETYQAERGAPAEDGAAALAAARADGQGPDRPPNAWTTRIATRALLGDETSVVASAAPVAAGNRSAVAATAMTPATTLSTCPGGPSPLARFLHSRKDACHDTP